MTPRIRLAANAGFTMIEVLIAMMLSIIVVGATAGLLVTGSTSSLAAQRHTDLIAIADQQIENLRAQVKTNPNGFSALAMSKAPACSSVPTDPAYCVPPTDPRFVDFPNDFLANGGASYLIETNYDNPAEGNPQGVPIFPGAAGAEPLTVAAGGIVIPVQSVPIAAGSTATATVYGYVTRTDVGCNAALGAGTCSGDARRLIVAVKLDQIGSRRDIGPNTPIYVSTLFTNPVPSNQPNNAVGLTLGVNLG